MKEDERFAFRALNGFDIKNLENGVENIECKDKESTMDIWTFLQTGTGKKTKFISLSKNIGISAEKYTIGKKADYTKPLSKRTPVILVDMQKLQDEYPDSTVHDLSTKEKFEDYYGKEYLYKRNGVATVMGHAIGDREVIVENSIPKEAFRIIPPIIVDVLVALEHDILGDKLKYRILNGIMENEINDETIKDMLSELNLDPLKQNFIENYYNGMFTMHSYGNELENSINNNSSITGFDLANSVKKSLIVDMMEALSKHFEIEHRSRYKFFIPEGKISATAKSHSDLQYCLNYQRCIDTYGIKLSKDEQLIIPNTYKYNEESNDVEVRYDIAKKEDRSPINMSYSSNSGEVGIEIDKLPNLSEKENESKKPKTKKKSGKMETEGVKKLKSSDKERQTKNTIENISQRNSQKLKENDVQGKNINNWMPGNGDGEHDDL